jgi:cell division protein FtsZ
MQDEVRVTVVATGRNRNVARQPVRGSDRGVEREIVRAPVKLVRNGSTGQVEYNDSSYTTAPATSSGFSGLRASRNEPAASAMDVGGGDAYLDIPAFLRRQAD